MHYYQFNIGDYKAATAHLSNEEDLAYRRLLDMYYDSEQKIPVDTQWVARRIRVEAAVVRDVLNDMFERHEDGWFHARCEDVIVAYHAMAEKNRANGRLGGRKKNPVGNPVASDTQPIAKATINYKLETINHKPKNTVATPEGVTDSVWQDWLSLRKTKKAAVTQTAIDGIAREASKAGVSLQTALETCCARGWTGFKADWLKDKGEQKSFAEKDYDFKRKQWEAMTGRTSESTNFLGIEDDSTH
jgi:uncharacterized protein YdaU (DUF1376 family)